MAGGLRAARMTLASWGEVLTSPPILTILLVTSLQMAGQFTLFPYLVPELQRVAAAPPETIALLLATFGASGVIGSMVIARLVGRLGTSTTIALCITNTITGLLVFALFTRDVPTAFLAIGIWGFAFAASNSLQQARLISVAPTLSSASVALNSSVLYVGQAIGTAVGAATLTAGHPERLGFHAAAIVLGALCLSLLVARLFRT
jgi:predicted MFS family arabinose efflux permease